ncbi:uncharacterized protein [Diabrotica undecimpunctata]|uniref:uncharacterized protein n=1 Tax=Diabrotica undecimpunctata TaxID=50387 RepID=UPI003B639464
MVTRTKNVTFTAITNTRAYQEGIESNLQKDVPDETNIDQLKEMLEDVLKKAQKKCQTKQTRRNEKHAEDTRYLMEKRREMKDKHTTNISERRNLNKTISKAVRKDIRNFDIKYPNNTIEQNKILKVLKRKLKTGTRNIYKLKNKQVHAINEQQEILKVIEKYYRTLYSQDAHIPEVEAKQNQGSDKLPDITEAEITTALKGMKNNKTPGEDGIVSEMIKPGGETVIQALKTLYDPILLFEEITPEKWNSGIMILLHEKGDITEIGSYRPISLCVDLQELEDIINDPNFMDAEDILINLLANLNLLW